MQMLLGQQQPGTVSANAILTDQLAKLAQTDPRIAPLVRHLQERLAARSDAVDTSSNDAETAPAKDDEILDVPPRDQELENLVQSMFAEVKTLRARNDMLATALGACHLCWGEDSNCSYCEGVGRVGAYVINSNLFERVVGPAVRQLRRRPKLAEPQPINKGDSHGTY
jgi:hypothetical protein